MSLIDQAKEKKTLIIALIAACAAVIVLIAVFMPSAVKKPEVTEEVISKRAKIEPQAPEQAPPPEVPQPVAKGPAPQASAVTAEAKKPAAKPEPEEAQVPEKVKAAEKAVKKEAVAEKPKKTVKAVPETGMTKAKEKTASSRLVAAKSRPWAVNIASYSDEGPAKELVASLRSAGYTAYTTEGKKSGKTWHRVRVGFYRTREDASRAGRTIEKKFNIPSTWVVKPAMNETAGHINR